MRYLRAVICLIAVVSLCELDASQNPARPARAAKLVLPRSAAAAQPRKTAWKAPLRLAPAVVRQLALDAGMPVKYSLSGTPASLSARQMYIDGTAYLSSPGAAFNTAADSPEISMTEKRVLWVHFRTETANAFVLIAVHGALVNGGGAQAKLLFYPPETPADPIITTTATAGVIPFAVQCTSAGWHQVAFVIEGLQVRYRVDRIDLSLFS